MGLNADSWTEDILPLLIRLAWVIGFLVIYGGSAAWVVRDAQKRGYSGAGLFLVLWACGPLSLLIWHLVRPRTELAERPVQEYTNADDALVAASKLDMLGDWNEAIALYQSVATRWPEHGGYAQECIKAIDTKKAGAET
jgi:hypothetical protein